MSAPQPSTPAPPPFAVGALCAAGTLPIVGQLYIALPLNIQLDSLTGAGQGTAALATTVFSLAYALGIVLIGPLTDRLGAHRTMVMSAGVTAAVTLATAFASSMSIFLAARALQGLAAAAFTPATLAYISRTSSPKNVPALNAAAIGAGMGAAVVAQVAAQVLVQAGGIRTVFLAGGGAIAVAAAGIKFGLSPDSRAGKHTGIPLRQTYGALGALVRRAPIAALLVTASTFLSSLVALYAGFQLSGDWDEQGLLILRAITLPAVVVAGFLITRITTVPIRPRLLWPLCSMCAAVAVCAASTSIVAVACAMVVFTGGLCIAAPTVVGEIVRWSEGNVGAATTLYTVAVFGGASLGAPLAAALGSGGSQAVAMACLLILVMGSASGFYSVRERAKTAGTKDTAT
ncbi:MAG: MFS transporter [Rhodococcus sp. (in: high G+C Gram-positive bacteria)]|uniref:MFS transporter n=1 Tax=unclassified Rhodococcus (in: high G+C Gram-positive bacteria) TaxID=192944 RepID=UPI0016055CCC|nr:MULTISPECIES: MFS transporter [unclassified Rhodococcus (in: high G+C Gram-positive bacteria)]